MALLWLPTLTAYAGTYVWTTYDAQGNITAQSPVYSGGSSYGQGYQGPGTHSYGPLQSPDGWGGGGGGVTNASATGAITATFTWQADPKLASDPPPAHILVTENSSASVSALNEPAKAASPTCNDGIGPAAVLTTTYYPNPTTPSYSVTTGSCQDTRNTVMSNKQTVTVTCTPTAVASGNQAACSAGVFYSVSISLDAVTISCPSIETSYYKSNNPETFGHDAHIRDAITGAMSVDSAVSPPLTQPGGGTTWTASPTLLAQVSGFQNPLFAWSMSGSGSLSNSSNSSHTILSVSFPVSSTTNSLGKQSTIHVSATDPDGATATNIYTVTWHYPDENWQKAGSSFQNSPIAFPSSDGPQNAGGQVHIPVTSDGIQWDVVGKIGGGLLSIGTTGIGILAPETDPIIIGFMNSTGYGLSVISPPPTPTPYVESGPQSQFQQDVSTELSIISGSTSGIFLPARPRMDPTLAVNVSHSGNYASYFSGSLGTLTFNATAYKLQWQQNYTGDSYGQNGYVGPAASSVNWDGQWQYVYGWFWTPTTNSPSH